MLVDSKRLLIFLDKIKFNDRVERFTLKFDGDGLRSIGHDTIKNLCFDVHDKSTGYDPLTLHIPELKAFRGLVEKFDGEIDLSLKRSMIVMKNDDLSFQIEELGAGERDQLDLVTKEDGFILNSANGVDYGSALIVDTVALVKATSLLSPVKSHVFGVKIDKNDLVIEVKEKNNVATTRMKGSYDGDLNIEVSDYIKHIPKQLTGMMKLQWKDDSPIMLSNENDSIVARYILWIRKC